jgi:hypothetical protein
MKKREKIGKLIAVAVVLLMFSCGQEAPTVDPADTTVTTSTTASTGYFYPVVNAVIPANGSTGVAVDTEYMIIFNMPVDSVDWADGNISITSGSSGLLTGSDLPATNDFTVTPITIGAEISPRIVKITFNNYGGCPDDLCGSDNLSITLGSGITDAETNSQPLNNAGTWTFTTGTEPDIDVPALLPATINPTTAATGVSITTPDIRIDFNEVPATGEIDPTSLNIDTFYLVDDAAPTVKIAATYSYTAASNTGHLTPVQDLTPGTSYTVTIVDGTIKDLSGNYINYGSNYTWGFTTETFGDLDATAPTITDGPNVFDITDTSVIANWTTDEATDYTLNYGRSDAFGLGPLTSASFTTFDSQSIAGLTAGQRYWLRVSVDDIASNGPVNSTTIQFNTITTEAFTAFDNTAGANEHTLYYKKWTPLSGNSGFFSFWTDDASTDNNIYGQQYNNSLTAQWNSTNPNALFTEGGQDYTYISSVDDEVDGVIVLASRGGTGIYAKRINSTVNGTAPHIVDWGTDADQSADTGLTIDAAGFNGSAVPVYSGIIQKIRTGTTEMGAVNNPFFDHNVNTTTFTNGYVIMDETNGDGTTIDNTNQNYRHMQGQTANIIAAGDTYYVGDNVTDTASFTANDHNMINLTDCNNGGNTVCTQHGITLAGLGGWLNIGDIIRVGTSYGRLTAVSEISVSPIDSGTANADRTNHLIDGTTDFTAATAVSVNDVVLETGSGLYENISGVTSTDLTLDSDLFPNGNEVYEVYETISSGTCNLYNNATNYFDDFGQNFIADGVGANDIIINLSDGSNTTVVSVVDADTLELTDDIFNAIGGDDYRIIDDAAAAIKTGTASADRNLHLIDGTKNWSAVVSVGDLVVETGTPLYTFVDTGGVSVVDLLLQDDYFPNGNEAYEIYDQYCSTHTATPIDTYLQLTVNWAIGVSDTDTVFLYNYTGDTGTADTPPANPLYDNDPTTVFTGGTAVAAGDIVVNYTDLSNPNNPNVAAVTEATYTIRARALDMDDDMFADGENYEIIRFLTNNTDKADIIDTGIATGGGAGILNDTGNTFTAAPIVNVGDIVYNLTADTYGMVTAVAATQLNLSGNITFAATDRYIIIRKRGILYVWQEAGPTVFYKVLAIGSGGAPDELVSENSIANSQNPKAIPDGLGNAFIVYENTTGGDIFVEKLDATGTSYGGFPVEIDTQTAYTETIIDVQTDTNNGVIILYKYNNDLYTQRIDNNGNRQWGVNGYSVDGDVGTTVTSQEVMEYDSANDDVVIVANVSNNIWAARVGTTSTWGPSLITNLTSIQQNPQIFLNGADTLITWDDNRFVSTVSWGVFGIKIDASTGTKDAGWVANAGGTDDYDGVSIILNNYNDNTPNAKMVPYNDGGSSILIWEDFRADGDESDLLYINPNAGLPY